MSENASRQDGRVGGIARRMVRKFRLTIYRFRSRGRLTFGEDAWIGPRARIDSPSFCKIGNRVGVGGNLIVEANAIIHDDVLISSNVSIVGNDHRFDDPSKTVFTNGRYEDPTVVIGGDNLIGNGVIIVGPVTIGKGCIVGAGAVVTKDLPEYTICVGIPAKPIKPRYKD
jgi:acetyltransferase-like isoleucine patch superfamily enzyme